MLPHHQQIQLDLEYPCPCHANGKLQQIVLTEAFGCDRCQRIFVLQADGLTIEELAATYPFKRRYYWDGKKFHSLSSFANRTSRTLVRSRDSWVLWLQCLGIIALVLSILRLYFRVTVTSEVFTLVLSTTIAILVLFVIMLWLFDQG